jgi:SPFH domain / Band 7 family
MRRLAPRWSIRLEGNDMIAIHVIVALLLVGLAASLDPDRDDADPVAGHHHARQRERRRVAVAYYRVADAVRSVLAIENVAAAINQIAQTTLRAVVGRHTLDETLSETETINRNIREILDVQTEDWGIKVTVVELEDIQLP